MKITLLSILLLSILVSGCTSELPSPDASKGSEVIAQSDSRNPNYPDLGMAPEFSNEIWINTEAPLRLADLRGQVVLLDMWTFG